jgi:hypothetical protein
MRVLAAVLLVAGCDPGFTMKGDVHDASGRPVSGARAVLTCNGTDQSAAETDAAGQFNHVRIGEFGNACAVDIRAPGHGTVSFPVMASCTAISRHWFHDDMCAEVTVHASIP